MMKSKLFACLALTTLCGGIFGVANKAQAFDPDGDITQPASIFVDFDFNGMTESVELGFIGTVGGDPTKLKYGLDKPFTMRQNGDEFTVDMMESILDPVGTFAVAFTDNNEASNFTTTFNFPIMPTIGKFPIALISSLGLTMTDSSPTDARDGVSVKPIAPATTLLSYKFYGPNGSAVLPASAGLNLGQSETKNPPGRTAVFLYEGDGGSTICGGLGGCTSYDLVLSFMGSGGGDKYGFTGSLEFEVPPGSEEIPEPLTMLGAGTALAFGGFFKRKLAKNKK